jgi:hypothetical protein
VVLNRHSDEISAMSFDGVSRILVGDFNSCLTEFAFDRNTGRLSKQHTYESLRIKRIKSIAQLGDLAVIGGRPCDSKYINKCVQAIDLKTRTPAKYIRRTAVKETIFSLELWRKSKSELVLYVCGNDLDFSHKKSSLMFDLKRAMQLDLVSPNQGISKEVTVIEMSKIT